MVIVLLSSVLITQSRGVLTKIPDLGEKCSVGKQYLLLIAINRYKYWHSLQCPVLDAKEIKEILNNRYNIDEIIELYDENATLTNIVQCFQDLQRTLKRDDSLLIFYSGHGHLDEASDNGFWIPVDGGKVTMDRWIANSYIRGIIRKMPSKHILLISDSCFSGSLMNIWRQSAPAINDDYFRRIYSLRCRHVITSGARERVPDRSEFADRLKLTLKENKEFYMDGLMLYERSRRGVKQTLPLFGELKGTNHEPGAGFLFFLREVPKKWEAWQRQLQSDVYKAKKYEDAPSPSSVEKRESWQRVLRGFQDNNPFSEKDEQLKRIIKQNIKYWTDRIKHERYYNNALNDYKKRNYPGARKNIRLAIDIEATPKALDLEEKIEVAIEGDNAYKAAQRTNTLESYMNYIEEYSSGMHLAEAYYNCGIIYFNEGKYHEAISSFSKTIELNPEEANAYYNRANSYSKLRKYRTAISDFKKAIKLTPCDNDLFKKIDSMSNIQIYLEFRKSFPSSPHLSMLKDMIKKNDKLLPPAKYWRSIKKNNKGYYECTFGEEHNWHRMIYVPEKKIWFDKYEVSNRHFKNLLEEEGQIHQKTGNRYIRIKDEYPVVVGYKYAKKYCKRYGFRLPKETEWNYAAGKGKFTYPWGNELPDANGIYRANYDSLDNDGIEKDGFEGTAPVKSFDKKEFSSPFGVVNMAGNVWEWVQGKVLKGGGFISEKEDLTIENRIKKGSEIKRGFRCVMDEQ